MDEDVGRSVVRQELLVVALPGAVIWLELLAFGSTPTGHWTVGAAAALVTALLAYAADRSRVGMWLLVAVGVLAVCGLVHQLVVASVPTGPVVAAMAGATVGFGLNRLLFGVLRPVPEARKRRERAT